MNDTEKNPGDKDARRQIVARRRRLAALAAIYAWRGDCTAPAVALLQELRRRDERDQRPSGGGR